MKGFLSFLLFLTGIALILYALPETRHALFPNTTSHTGRMAPDTDIHPLAIAAAAISWLLATILQVQNIKLKRIELAEKTAKLKKKR